LGKLWGGLFTKGERRVRGLKFGVSKFESTRKVEMEIIARLRRVVEDVVKARYGAKLWNSLSKMVAAVHFNPLLGVNQLFPREVLVVPGSRRVFVGSYEIPVPLNSGMIPLKVLVFSW